MKVSIALLALLISSPGIAKECAYRIDGGNRWFVIDEEQQSLRFSDGSICSISPDNNDDGEDVWSVQCIDGKHELFFVREENGLPRSMPIYDRAAWRWACTDDPNWWSNERVAQPGPNEELNLMPN